MDLAALTEANRVRVVVLPVGSPSPKRFKYFYQLIASFHTLQLAHMTRNVMDKNRAHLLANLSNSLLCCALASRLLFLPRAQLIDLPHLAGVLKQDWSNGVFRFQFIDFKDWHKSEWEELHATRKAFAVVGIIDGTVTSDWVRRRSLSTLLSHNHEPCHYRDIAGARLQRTVHSVTAEMSAKSQPLTMLRTGGSVQDDGGLAEALSVGPIAHMLRV